jgi:hypothetical protein
LYGLRVEWVGGEDGLSDGGALGTVGGGASALGWWGWVSGILIILILMIINIK